MPEPAVQCNPVPRPKLVDFWLYHNGCQGYVGLVRGTCPRTKWWCCLWLPFNPKKGTNSRNDTPQKGSSCNACSAGRTRPRAWVKIEKTKRGIGGFHLVCILNSKQDTLHKRPTYGFRSTAILPRCLRQHVREGLPQRPHAHAREHVRRHKRPVLTEGLAIPWPSTLHLGVR